ncbi:MAG: hypothetical protein AAGF12_08980 [Myxococcota bacterium]
MARVMKDRDGRPIRAGTEVRIVSVPDLSAMGRKAQSKSLPVFEHLVGTYR